MKKVTRAAIKVLLFIWLLTAYIAGLVITKDGIYFICMLTVLYFYFDKDIEVRALERRIKKYKKAMNEIAERIENKEE